MGFLKLPLTMVSIAAFPILIGLGIDYAIQFQNRIEEEFQRGESIASAAIDTIAHTAPAVLIALIITGAGFSSLFSSTVPMIQDFGLLCLVGIIMCYLSALFVGVTVLYQMERGRTNRKSQNGEGRKEKESPIGPLIVKLAAFVCWWWRPSSLPWASMLTAKFRSRPISKSSSLRIFRPSSCSAISKIYLAEPISSTS